MLLLSPSPRPVLFDAQLSVCPRLPQHVQLVLVLPVRSDGVQRLGGAEHAFVVVCVCVCACVVLALVLVLVGEEEGRAVEWDGTPEGERAGGERTRGGLILSSVGVVGCRLRVFNKIK